MAVQLDCQLGETTRVSFAVWLASVKSSAHVRNADLKAMNAGIDGISFQQVYEGILSNRLTVFALKYITALIAVYALQEVNRLTG